MWWGTHFLNTPPNGTLPPPGAHISTTSGGSRNARRPFFLDAMKLLSLLAASLFTQSAFGLSVPDFSAADFDIEKRGAVLCTANTVELQPGGYYQLE